MKKSLDIFVWAILLFLITPSGMALASWNAVPGDYTYSWKLSLEKVLLWALSPSDTLQSSTQVKIAERRFGEVEQVLDSEYAVESLQNLNQQLDETTNNILEISKDESRSEVTDKYIATLKEMSNSLSEQKTKAQTGAIAVVPQKTTIKNTNTTSTKTISQTQTQNQAKSQPNTQTQTQTQNQVQNQAETQTQVAQPTAVVSIAQGTPVPAVTNNETPEQTESTEDKEVVVDEISKTEDRIQETIDRLEKEREKVRNKTNNDRTNSKSSDETSNESRDANSKNQIIKDRFKR